MLRRIVAISDLHIGGSDNPMLGHPELLEDFLRKCAELKAKPGEEEIELVIHGDFIDFLAEEPGEAWTSDEARAERKLANVVGRSRGIFKELARCAKNLSGLTILLGNHDIELAYPRVRDALFRELGTSPHRCHFIANNEAYRVGDLLIEHGNRYDTWNAIDHDGLREIVSAASRGERPARKLAICPGSRLVNEVMNPLKERYHFVDLLKPEDKLVLLLLTTLEPALKSDLGSLYGAVNQWVAQTYRAARWKAAQRDDAQPGEPELVSTTADERLPAALAEVFQAEIEVPAHEMVGLGDDLLKLFMGDPMDSLRSMLLAKKTIPEKRLRQLQLAVEAKLVGDLTFDEQDATNIYADAAFSMTDAGIAKVVVMGHTHLCRDVKRGDARYINTGTWADLMQVDPKHLVDTAEARRDFVEWLTKLVANELEDVRTASPGFADITIDADGHVKETQRPMLRRHMMTSAV